MIRAARALIHLFTLTALAVVALSALPADASAVETKVINGDKTEAADFTARWESTVALLSSSIDDPRDAQFCAGTLISATRVVTAAHCVSDWGWVDPYGEEWFWFFEKMAHSREFIQPEIVDATSIQVLGGRRTLSDSDGSVVDVEQIYVHKDYDLFSNRNDIALLDISATPDGAVPIDVIGAADTALWGNGDGVATDPAEGPWVAGWGTRTIDPFWGEPTSIANTLEDAVVPIHSDDICDAGGDNPDEGAGWGRYFDAATMLCAGTLDTRDLNDANLETTGVDTCFGDSGGPLTVGDGLGAFRLVGITSFGSWNCADASQHGVYTRVDAMRSWIEQEHVDPVVIDEAPTVMGAPVVDIPLTCDPGTWTGGEPITYSYQWYQAEDNFDPDLYNDELEDESDFMSSMMTPLTLRPFTRLHGSYGVTVRALASYGWFEPIPLATTAGFTPTEDQLHRVLFCEVTAENNEWDQRVLSQLTAPVAEALEDPRIGFLSKRCTTTICRIKMRARTTPNGGVMEYVKARYARIYRGVVYRGTMVAAPMGNDVYRMSFTRRPGTYYFNFRAKDQYGGFSPYRMVYWYIKPLP